MLATECVIVMPHSLVARLSLLVALIIGVAFVLLLTIQFRSTSAAFVRTTEIVRAEADQTDLQPRVLDAARSAYLRNRRAGLVGLSEEPTRHGLPGDAAFLILAPDLSVLATTETILERARISRLATGMLRIESIGADPGVEAALQLTMPLGAELRDGGDTLVGYVLVLPARLEEDPGDRFARDVWRSAATWLLAVMAISMLLTALTLRWFLRPIDRLTIAAHALVNGSHPQPMPLSGHSEIDRLIGAFNAASAAVAQTEALRRQLISDIAHELRTPVTNLSAQIEAAGAGLIAADGALLESLGNDVQMLARLVEDFQQLALSDAGQLRLTLETLPLATTIHGIVAPLAERFGAGLALRIPDELQVRADSHRLRQVFSNLVENSVRHCAAQLQLTIHAEPIGPDIRIRFADNGPGISGIDQPHVFERFYRAEKSRNRATGGAGLGLTIAKALIEAMAGRMRCLPDQGQGAVFEIELPCAGLQGSD